MICIYHSRDLDGICSGAILQKRYPDAQMIGYDYGEPFPPDIKPDDDLIMADVSIPIPLMVKVSKQLKSFAWIDHHVSAANDFLSLEDKGNVEFTYNPKLAACELTWEFCYPSTPVPTTVSLLGIYDSWRNDNKDFWEKTVLPFQWGMRLVCNDLKSFPAMLLDHNFAVDTAIKLTIEKGASILQYQRMQDERACRAAFEVIFEGYRAVCLNAGGSSRETFRSIWNEEKYRIMMPFSFSKDKWIISIYTTREDVDCSKIAKLWGGGGHKKFAGFTIKDIKQVFPDI